MQEKLCICSTLYAWTSIGVVSLGVNLVSSVSPLVRLSVAILFFFFESEFLSRARITRYRGGHVGYILCLGMGYFEKRSQRRLA